MFYTRGKDRLTRSPLICCENLFTKSQCSQVFFLLFFVVVFCCCFYRDMFAFFLLNGCLINEEVLLKGISILNSIN